MSLSVLLGFVCFFFSPSLQLTNHDKAIAQPSNYEKIRGCEVSSEITITEWTTETYETMISTATFSGQV